MVCKYIVEIMFHEMLLDLLVLAFITVPVLSNGLFYIFVGNCLVLQLTYFIFLSCLSNVEICLFLQKDLSKPVLAAEEIDDGNGITFLHVDTDNNVVFMAEKVSY